MFLKVLLGFIGTALKMNVGSVDLATYRSRASYQHRKKPKKTARNMPDALSFQADKDIQSTIQESSKHTNDMKKSILCNLSI